MRPDFPTQQPSNRADSGDEPASSEPRRFSWQPRYTLATLMLLTFIGSMIGAAASYLIHGRNSELGWLLMPFVIMVPMGLMVLLSWILDVVQWFLRR